MKQLATAATIAIVVASAARGQPPADEFAYMEWRWIQEELTKAGLEPGPVDGRPGAKTHAAIEAWQRASGQPGTGVLTTEQMKTLVFIRPVRTFQAAHGTYNGELVGEERTGRGHFVGQDGSWYRGEFLNGARHGFGVTELSSGMRHEGQYRNDQPHGLGILTWPTGDRYEGDFVRGQRTGRGVYTWGKGPWEMGWSAPLPIRPLKGQDRGMSNHRSGADHEQD